ncbi:MAG: hypothetical protein EXS08_15060 [Planctomycetes bacterium]|nr:hypothetical protein [Planctomycetota bacterium]
MIVAWTLALTQASAAPKDAPPGVAVPAAEVRAARERAVHFLLETQNADGSWGGARNASYNDLWENPETHEAWTVATSGLVVMALLGEGEGAQAALARALPRLVSGTALKRCSEWDMDDFWGYAYGLQALARVLADPRFAAAPQHAELERAARTYHDKLVGMRSGGWGYYANAEDAWRPAWTTSFGSATAVLALVDARRAGLAIDEASLHAGVRALELCRLPTGAYTYSLEAFPSPGPLEGIDQLKPSIGRTQACNAALRAGGSKAIDDAALARDLDAFFEHHRFLQIAKGRPIPHEAYYRVASYFFWYGHWHAALAIDELPEARRAGYAAQLARLVVKNQEADGSMWDHVMHDYPRFYGTAYGVLTLQSVEHALAR